ncbi:hypothetical protein DENSPDRAFT_272580 [Dentipellis sp. KUC8613]|nr:hypothetical protein DENSPDRAFT_272580 [Dentipellis sp. KUC8613]
MEQAASSPGLSCFAVELLTMTFKQLHYKDLLECSKVCKRFWSVIKCSLDLQYILELGADGLVECSAVRIPLTADRLGALLDHRSRWHSLHWSKSGIPTSNPTPSGVLDFSSGVFAQIEFINTDPASLHEGILKIAYFQTGVEAMTESRSITNGITTGPLSDQELARITQVRLQPLADLLAIVQSKVIRHSDAKAVFRIHLRSLSSEGSERDYPCPSPVLEYFPVWGHANTEPQIDEVTLDWHFISMRTASDDGLGYTVWNYKTGKMVLDIPPTAHRQKFSNFSLINETSFIASSTEKAYNDTQLDIISIFSFDSSPVGNGAGTKTLVMRLALPQRISRVNADARIDIFTGRFSPRAERYRGDILFTTAEESHVYLICVHTNRTLGIIVHRSTLISLADKFKAKYSTKDPIPWEEWGPLNTRCFQIDSSHLWQHPARSVHGERVILRVQSGDGRSVLQIMDFNNRRRRRDEIPTPKAILATGHSIPKYEYVTAPSTLHWPEIYTAPISSSLPYHAVPVSNAEPDNGYLLDAQGLVRKRLSLNLVPGGGHTATYTMLGV